MDVFSSYEETEKKRAMVRRMVVYFMVTGAVLLCIVAFMGGPAIGFAMVACCLLLAAMWAYNASIP